MESEPMNKKSSSKLGVVSGVYIPGCLNILSILMFLRFGLILGQVGLLGILGLLIVAYVVDFVTTLSLSAIASNGEVKGGGAYYLISRSLGPEFGGSIGLLFYLSQVLNTSLNVVGLIDCLKSSFGYALPRGYWYGYALQTVVLLLCTGLCLAGSGLFAKASNGLLVILVVSVLSIPFSALFNEPFADPDLGVQFTGPSLATLQANLLPRHSTLETFRSQFGILFPATSGIFAGASMSGDLRNPSKSIPKGTLWALLTTFVAYLLVILSISASITHSSFLNDTNIIKTSSIWSPIILAGECATTFFSALMGVIGAAKLMQALARDKLFPVLGLFGRGTKKGDEPLLAIFVTYAIAQAALFADLNQIATFISMGYQMTFFVMNLACFLLKIGSAPNFRPSFKFFSWQSAAIGSIASAAAMFFIDATYAASAVCLLVFLFLLIHYLSPPKRWGDVSQNLIYHQVRKYLLRLRPEHIKFWRPQIILLVNDPRRQTRLIQFCNSMKKGALYILGHVIVTDDFSMGVHEARLQQNAWTKYISEFSRIKAFVQLTMSPTIVWGVRNLILSAGLGGMRPNIAIIGSYNLEEFRQSNPQTLVPVTPSSPVVPPLRPQKTGGKRTRNRGDTSARLMAGFLPTDVIKTETSMSVTDYVTILEDLALKYRLNMAVGKGFDRLETPRGDGANAKKYIDLWPIQMSAELTSDEGKSVLTTNFDTYTLILQLGYILHTVPAWKHAYMLRVMVFVEYENEVDEEQGRVKALLDKLRIDAEVIVFWLASGNLQTYETIIHGRCDDPYTDDMVNECLQDEEWWEDLRIVRGTSTSMATSQELTSFANLLGATAGRPGIYNPHFSHEETGNKRRSSKADLEHLPSHPTIAQLTRRGVNMGFHTTSLAHNVFDGESDDEPAILYKIDSKENESPDSSDVDAKLSDVDTAASDGDLEDYEPAIHPLLGAARRRQSHGDLLQRCTGRKKKERGRGSKKATTPGPLSYGTMSTRGPVVGPEEYQGGLPPLFNPQRSGTLSARSRSPIPSEANTPGRDNSPPRSPTQPESRQQRPPLLRPGSSMRFTSTVLPKTTVTNGSDAGSTLAFALHETPTLDRPERPGVARHATYGGGHIPTRPVPAIKTPRPEDVRTPLLFSNADAPSAPQVTRPGLSRHSSYGAGTGRLSSRPIPETKITNEDETGPRIDFAKAEVSSHRPTQSRNVSEPGLGDAKLDIPALLDSYKLKTGDDADTASTYSTAEPGIDLSFNELPSRAQHLILNELMRRNSHDTAVLFSTLPVPEEGTCRSEEASVRYLSDIEVLGNDLPPMLLVLSNNMTVTVSL